MAKPLNVDEKYCWLMCQGCGRDTLVQHGADQTGLVCPDCAAADWLASKPLAFVEKPLTYTNKLQLFPEELSVLWDANKPTARIALYTSGSTLLLRPVIGGPKVAYDSARALEDLGGVPEIEELERLFLYYPKYKHQIQRVDLLQGVLAGHSHSKLLATWIEDKEQQMFEGQQKGGPGKSVPSKIKRLVMRLLYLRDRFGGTSQVDANNNLGALFNLGPSSIAKITKSTALNHELGA